MTREEAIKILKAIRVYECYPKSASEETKEAIDMAIEALSVDAEEMVLHKILEKGIIELPRYYYGGDPEELKEYVAVVRCKDCRHRVHDEERGLYYCKMYYGQGDVSDENFCQWGERSTK